MPPGLPERLNAVRLGAAELPATADPHKPLRQDVRLLGELLGNTLSARLGEQFFETVEHVRRLAKEERRQAVPGGREERRQAVPGGREERRQAVPADQEERRQAVPGDREERRQAVPEDQASLRDETDF